MPANRIEHHPQRHCFTVHTDGKESILQYRLLVADAGNPGVDFTRTYVPEQLRGQGIAEALVRRGLSWAKAQNLQIQASCWYVQKFLR
ncbi:GNAT family N-acetyltransferase [Pseudohongiella sp.]|uniref:N-acetyltransferase domain-containing protein n=1 Tax=marine sediment metagenome TaxID=412755 RepID=A0A0F9YVW1_9ZZZZ|nr:GNAT family N-acetyltransferase [Pseudohongiella sp.]HDZ07985.1 N-acetyltransferase [Pseudohongiella sp.]HEA64172.1 N-acetyltransferase [Pseudohongiella sp.]